MSALNYLPPVHDSTLNVWSDSHPAEKASEACSSTGAARLTEAAAACWSEYAHVVHQNI